ncbi:MAG: hypothetical protein BWY61_00110 [Firmicutes bacterium ADurb.Bin354]|nr:MAG: hypothetical protein BWY61_00110 [Firmicutes bacterium ADurb.Bin354]
MNLLFVEDLFAGHDGNHRIRLVIAFQRNCHIEAVTGMKDIGNINFFHIAVISGLGRYHISFKTDPAGSDHGSGICNITRSLSSVCENHYPSHGIRGYHGYSTLKSLFKIGGCRIRIGIDTHEHIPVRHKLINYGITTEAYDTVTVVLRHIFQSIIDIILEKLQIPLVTDRHIH